MSNRLRWVLPTLVAMIVAGVAITAAFAQTDKGAAPAAQQKKWRIALSNSFIGNKWRIEMENLFKAGCKMPPYKAQVDCSVYNSGNDVSKQTQQMSNLISQHVDAIVLNAASPTGLNGIIGQACARGILVVSYDNVVTAPCALKVNTDQFKFGQVLAHGPRRSASTGKGNVIMVTGVSGHASSTSSGTKAPTRSGRRTRGSRSSPATPACGTRRRRSGTRPRSCRPCRRSNGIWAQGGTDGVLKAFIDAKRTPLPPTAR